MAGRFADPRRALRILYSYPGPCGSTGSGDVAWHQVTELVRAGHSVTLVAASVERPLERLRSLHQTLVLAGRPVPYGVIGRSRALAWHDVRVATLLNRETFDVVHTWPHASARTLLAARAKGIPGLREVPGTAAVHALDVVGREYARLGLAVPLGWSDHVDGERVIAEDRELAAAAALLVPSAAVAETLLSRGIDGSRVLRHRYGFDPDVFRVPVRDDPSRPFTAVYVGRCEPRKGLHHALGAWIGSKASSTGRFLIYGTFVPGYRDLLADRLAHPSVEVRGFTHRPARAYAQADILLTPSVEEGSALETYEAQGVGVIPLVSRESGAVVVHAVNGLIHSAGDADTLSSQIDLVFESQRWRRALRRGVLEQAQSLTWRAASGALVNAYRRAIAEAAPDGPLARPSAPLPAGNLPRIVDQIQASALSEPESDRPEPRH